MTINDIFNTSVGGADPRRADWGLCRAAHERDSCGFGLIASLDDRASHWVVQTAISSLNRLTHRGAIAADGKTGDGCGLLIKQPTGFLRAVAAEAGFALAPLFASGLVFLSRDAAKAAAARAALTEQLRARIARRRGFSRVAHGSRAPAARRRSRRCPRIEQMFVNCRAPTSTRPAFNRKLFMARRRCRESARGGRPGVLCAVACRPSTIVYKGMVMPQYLARVLSGPQGSAARGLGGGVSPALLHQHAAAMAARASVSATWRTTARSTPSQGNRSWAVARGPLFRSPLLPDLSDVLPLVSLTGSDSQIARQHARSAADRRSRSACMPCAC